MRKLKSLYHPFHLKKNYKDINEEEILSSLYVYRIGTIEEVVARLINETVLRYMNIYMDSTIMQLVALNEYLCGLFLENLEPLIFNYMLAYLEECKIETIDEETVSSLENLAQSTTIKTSLEDLILLLEKQCKV